MLTFNEFLLRRKESLSPGGDCQKRGVKSLGWKNRLICLSFKKEKLYISFTEREKRSRDQERSGEEGACLFVSQAGRQPMRQPEEGRWEGHSVHPLKSNRGQFALRGQTGSLPGRLLFLFILIFFVLVVRVVHQTNQSSLHDW